MKSKIEYRNNRDKANLWAALISSDGLEVLSTRSSKKLRRSLKRGRRILLDIRPLKPGIEYMAKRVNALRAGSKELALKGLDWLIVNQFVEICGFETSDEEVNEFVRNRALEDFNVIFERH